MKKATVDLFTRIFSVLAPPPDMTISQWADEYRRLSSESSAEPGRWRTSKAPYQREIMDAVCDMRVQKVVIMSAAQIGKTDALILNPIGYYMHYDPSPIRRASKSNEKRKLKKQRALLDKGKITLAAIEQSYGSWRSHAEKGNCYHLIRETDQIFRSLFPESVWLNGKRKARTDGESYFCGYLASPEEVRNTLSEGEKQTRSERTWQRR